MAMGPTQDVSAPLSFLGNLDQTPDPDPSSRPSTGHISWTRTHYSFTYSIWTQTQPMTHRKTRTFCHKKVQTRYHCHYNQKIQAVTIASFKTALTIL